VRMEGSNTPSTIGYTHSPPLMRRTSAVLHFAYLSVSAIGCHLLPFAMRPVFPSSDYYGSSVVLRLAPGRQSHVYAMENVLA
jgi:hypothetical protein